MRDSVLAVSGLARVPISAGRPRRSTEPPFSSRRTLYGFIDRQNLDGLYRTFDFAVPDATSPRRFVTTVPQQALFLMNSPFLHEQARRLAGEIAGRTRDSRDSRGRPRQAVRRLYRRVLGRPPEPDELALADAFVAAANGAMRNTAWKPGSRPKSAAGKEPQLSPWEQLSQVLLLTNEFMFVD